MLFTVRATGTRTSNEPFDAYFLVHAVDGTKAARKVETELDWQDAKNLLVTARAAKDEEVRGGTNVTPLA
jgi:hypothetical protein